jgi:hypothetical protein
MKWIDEKMKLLGVTNNTKYKIAFHLDSLSMISVHTKKYGVIEVRNVFPRTCSIKKRRDKHLHMLIDLVVSRKCQRSNIIKK